MIDSILGELTDSYKGLYAPQRLWQGEIQIKIFSEPLLVQFEGTDDRGMTPPLHQALETFIQQQEHYQQLAMKSLLEYYQTTILPLWHENDYFGAPELANKLVPTIKDTSEFEKLLSYPRLLLHNGKSWGLEFECTWDVEHGAGVLFSNGKVVEVGLAEVASYADK
jgi:hypothetical protein